MTYAATDGPTDPVFRLIYRSHSRIPADDRPVALAEILRVARSANARAAITGALLITDNWFVQALEGQESTVRALYERIGRDARHEHVTLIESGSQEARVFSRWAMAQVSASGQADIPLEAVEGEEAIRPAAATEPLTREQTAVLRVMRNSIGADVL
jgi:Sensors of blue-light using FAD